MVLGEQYSKMILETFPNFQNSKTWGDHVDDWGDNDPMNIYRVMCSFARYTMDEILAVGVNSQEKTDVFIWVENVVTSYEGAPRDSQEFAFWNAACTVFLEHLINNASNNLVYQSNNVTYESFVPFLGPNSIEYCKAWDEFTGVKTPGLWDQDK